MWESESHSAFNYLGYISNDITTYKAIISIIVVSSGSLVISNALCVRLGVLIKVPGGHQLLGQDFGVQRSANGD